MKLWYAGNSRGSSVVLSRGASGQKRHRFVCLRRQPDSPCLNLSTHQPTPQHIPNPGFLDKRMHNAFKKRKAEPGERDQGAQNKRARVSFFFLCNHKEFRTAMSWHRNRILVLQLQRALYPDRHDRAKSNGMVLARMEAWTRGQFNPETPAYGQRAR
jgi:hypothetical protein